MKKILLTCSIISSVIVTISCSPKIAKTTSTEASTSTTIASNYTAQELQEGKILMEANCARCHKLKAPENYTVESWNKILKRMIPKSKATDEENAKISAYILSLAKTS